MIKIGAINIDVSHPLAFSAVLHDSERARYTAVFNDGFREFDEVEGFAKKEKIKLAGSLMCGLGLIFVGLDIMSSDQAFRNDQVMDMFESIFAVVINNESMRIFFSPSTYSLNPKLYDDS